MGYDPFLLYYAIEQDFWMSGQFGGNFSFNKNQVQNITLLSKDKVYLEWEKITILCKICKCINGFHFKNGDWLVCNLNHKQTSFGMVV